jgi:hydroxymethylpyrimidine pyrophosphatase-like HAD family hydrolase
MALDVDGALLNKAPAMVDKATLEAIKLGNFDGHRRIAPWPQRRAGPSHP